jgi:cleavage and polyadenylation specificity factor subunit 2
LNPSSGDEAVKAFDSRRENAFDLKHVHTCHCLEELAKLPSPKVVIATSSDLSNGFSADLLPSLLSQPRGLLLLTRRASLGSVAGQLGATPTPRCPSAFSGISLRK